MASSVFDNIVPRVESDTRFVLQIETNVGRREAELNITLNLHNKSNVRQDSIQQLTVPKTLSDIRKADFL